MPIEIQSDGENLIFFDYANRKVTIKETDFLQLMMSEERRSIRPILEDCLKNPTEVWWNIEDIEGKNYSYYKFFKVYSNLVFVALVLMDEALNFHLNNFYGFAENEFELAEKERKGRLIRSNLNHK